MKLYITDMSLFVLAVFYLPVVLWGLWKLLKQPISVVKKTALAILLLVLAYAIPLGDVTINSLAMAKVCPTAGLHIYRTVEVEGFAGHYSLDGSPYRFIEFPTLGVNQIYYWERFEKQPDGSISMTKLDQPTAEYEISYEQWHVDIKRSVESSAYVVRNRLSGEVLAERNLFNPLPGWLDRVLVYRWFGYGGREGCHGAPAYGFEPKVLIPKQSNH